MDLRNLYKMLLEIKYELVKLVVIFINFYNVCHHSYLQGQIYCNVSLEYQDKEIFYLFISQTYVPGLFHRQDFYSFL